MMRITWFQIIVFLLLAGLVKGGLHIVKIVILAGLGLAGMWMLHTLAQDYDKISNRFMLSSSPQNTKTNINKRSSDTADYSTPKFPELRWEVILSQDPENCVPNFVCQLAAIPEEKLLQNERNVLKLIRATSAQNTFANKIIKQAISLGENSNTFFCRKYYSTCPYTKEKILVLLRTYGET